MVQTPTGSPSKYSGASPVSSPQRLRDATALLDAQREIATLRGQLAAVRARLEEAQRWNDTLQSRLDDEHRAGALVSWCKGPLF